MIKNTFKSWKTSIVAIILLGFALVAFWYKKMTFMEFSASLLIPLSLFFIPDSVFAFLSKKLKAESSNTKKQID